ncbi:MAG: hypothetical protein AB7P40_11650, partial [Chloroflexota bacterium]
VFTLASATADTGSASPEAVASGMRITFAVAAALVVAALAIAASSRIAGIFRPAHLLRVSASKQNREASHAAEQQAAAS